MTDRTAGYGAAITAATTARELNALADRIAREAHLGAIARADVELLQVAFTHRCRRLFPAVFR